MNKKKKLFLNSLNAGPPVTYPSFQYGDLSALHPSETYSQLKTRRQTNYALFKTLCESGSEFYLPGRRLELDIPTSSKIVSSSINPFLINSGLFSSLLSISPRPFTYIFSIIEK